jgi:hypothetical protein
MKNKGKGRKKEMSQLSPGNVGKYNVSISFFTSPWKKDKPKTPVTTGTGNRRKKTLKPVIHPIFEQCASLSNDEFWQNTFMDCARGKFPRGYSFKNNLLTHKKGNKVSTLELNNSPTDVFIMVLKFFQSVSGILSEADRKRKQDEEDIKLAEEAECEDITWRDVRVEKLKEVMISEFINSLSSKMKFNEEEKRELITTVKKGLMLKYFNSNNIVMEGGRIVEIDGLIFNRNTNQYEIDKVYIRNVERKSQGLGVELSESKPPVDFLEIWRKYLESLDNKRTKKNITFSSSNMLDSDEEFSPSVTM